MDRDRIWSRVRTGYRDGAVELPPTSNRTELGTSGVDAVCIAGLEAERDEALAEARRMHRAFEVARQTAVQERDEAQAEIEQLRRALEIARHAIESERDMARRERERLAAQLKAQQKPQQNAQQKCPRNMRGRGGLSGRGCSVGSARETRFGFGRRDQTEPFTGSVSG